MGQPPAFRPSEARKETIATRVAGVLRAEILAADLPPGEKINLDRLRERLGVSLAPVREAMTRLVADGLVEVEDQRGYRVAPVSAANLTEITQLRLALEPLALETAIARGSLEWEGGVLAALHRLERTPPTDPARAAAHRAFHAALADGAAMPMLAAFCLRLLDLTGRYLALLGPVQVEAPDHAAIAAAAVSRRGAEACDLLTRHIAASGAALAAARAARPAAFEEERP